MTMAVVSAVHCYPVKSMAGCAPGEAAVEPWGLAGDRRWMLAGPDARVLTQRQEPRLTLASARPLPGGGVRLTTPGAAPLDVRVPTADGQGGTLTVELFRDKVETVPAGAAADAWLSAFLGTDARLVYMDDPARRRPVDPEHSLPGDTVSFADGYPLLITATASLEALNSLIAEGDRAAEGPLPMDRFRPNVVVDGTPPWAEDGWRRVRLGEVTFRVAKPSGRCVVTTTDQRTAVRGKEPLRTLARHHRIGAKAVFGQNLIPEHTGVVRVGDAFEVLD
ncbi:MOSC domain-containing protein [Streptomyces cinnamoneus]|uniref:MOSC domain-containing protein n=1 Tax=Streptomyces cinnamoneus TaxID=53446 RepID=A0A2G1XM14_STRCJ|nr:MOSC N-terminal beta barrel domain-containing protein [Streptomyces cinnamoneus]PHQ52278.1 MOSC domain-containing protein [Streptomyces cinnamoneus]PPT16333.1 MOSC domain-containing protein [Streptomyces cinnamoneus]